MPPRPCLAAPPPPPARVGGADAGCARVSAAAHRSTLELARSDSPDAQLLASHLP